MVEELSWSSSIAELTPKNIYFTVAQFVLCVSQHLVGVVAFAALLLLLLCSLKSKKYIFYLNILFYNILYTHTTLSSPQQKPFVLLCVSCLFTIPVVILLLLAARAELFTSRFGSGCLLLVKITTLFKPTIAHNFFHFIVQFTLSLL